MKCAEHLRKMIPQQGRQVSDVLGDGSRKHLRFPISNSTKYQLEVKPVGFIARRKISRELRAITNDPYEDIAGLVQDITISKTARFKSALRLRESKILY